MNREAVFSGVIGGVCGLIVTGALFGWMGLEPHLINLYIVMGLSGFFGSFFARFFASK
jgi:hypothetical protein